MSDDSQNSPSPPSRRRSKKSGRVEHDERGNAVWVRTRASDQPEIASLGLSIVEDAPGPLKTAAAPVKRPVPKKIR